MRIFLTLMILTLSLQALALDPDPNPRDKVKLDPELVELINKVDAATATIQTLEARFKQRKDVSLLKEPVIMEGTFYFQRKKGFKFVFDPQYDLVIVINNTETVAISDKAKRAERLKYNKRYGRLMERLMSDKLKSLTEHFAIEKLGNPDQAGGHHLKLTPLKRRIKKQLQEIQIWVDSRNMIYRVAGTKKDGDRFELSLHDIKLNEAIPTQFFETVIPSDYKVGDRLDFLSGAGAAL